MAGKKNKPDNREYTIMVVPHGKESVFNIKIPVHAIKIAIVCLVVVVLGMVGVFVNYGYTVQIASADKKELNSLRQTNKIQQEKIEKIAKETTALKEDMVRINQLEADVRRLVNTDEYVETSRSGGNRPSKEGYKGQGGPANVKDINQLENMVKELHSSVKARNESLTTLREELIARNERIASTPSIWPTDGDVTSRFGWRSSPFGWGSDWHPGIDIANDYGTPIMAAAAGEVVYSGWYSGYGKTVQIDHGNGIVTLYGHCSELDVAVGQKVKKGDVISYMGSTGLSTGSHLHYEVRVNGSAVNPSSFLNM